MKVEQMRVSPELYLDEAIDTKDGDTDTIVLITARLHGGARCCIGTSPCMEFIPSHENQAFQLVHPLCQELAQHAQHY